MNKPVDNASVMSPVFSPLYQQIKALLMQCLVKGDWKAGEIIPSEVELAQIYKVSQGTVRKAIDELTNENLLVRKQGRGTFVATHQENKTRFRFLRMNADTGQEIETKSTILDILYMKAPAEVAHSLEIKSNVKVVRITRLLSFFEKPTVFEYIWLPSTIFSDVTQEKIENFNGTLYGWFEAEYDVRMIRASEKIRAVLATREIADLLSATQQTPILLVERLSFTYEDKPVEMRQAWYLTDDYYYFNELI